MRSRARMWVVGAAVVAALAVGAGPASASALDYYQFHDHYATHEECVAVGEEYLWPNHPGGADAYECRENAGGWDLWLIFAT
ncbi:hypothetical protein E1265_28255 [Streptomyces sp. 8K308]|uniref:hypothetical protein n=1 Tax=Streptomyces sp. 8K308 TaxID=2530388 RepID=UPI00105051E2|nr:hypothetical protein [Streptomyces sp. 8K308]TDC13299.1 hypothetical protein E1265_28255 [Streptomyces sp. 8K308]